MIVRILQSIGGELLLLKHYIETELEQQLLRPLLIYVIVMQQTLIDIPEIPSVTISWIVLKTNQRRPSKSKRHRRWLVETPRIDKRAQRK